MDNIIISIMFLCVPIDRNVQIAGPWERLVAFACDVWWFAVCSTLHRQKAAAVAAAIWLIVAPIFVLYKTHSRSERPNVIQKRESSSACVSSIMYLMGVYALAVGYFFLLGGGDCGAAECVRKVIVFGTPLSIKSHHSRETAYILRIDHDRCGEAYSSPTIWLRAPF